MAGNCLFFQESFQTQLGAAHSPWPCLSSSEDDLPFESDAWHCAGARQLRLWLRRAQHHPHLWPPGCHQARAFRDFANYRVSLVGPEGLRRAQHRPHPGPPGCHQARAFRDFANYRVSLVGPEGQTSCLERRHSSFHPANSVDSSFRRAD